MIFGCAAGSTSTRRQASFILARHQVSHGKITNVAGRWRCNTQQAEVDKTQYSKRKDWALISFILADIDALKYAQIGPNNYHQDNSKLL